jgi:hypothetical protein
MMTTARKLIVDLVLYGDNRTEITSLTSFTSRTSRLVRTVMYPHGYALHTECIQHNTTERQHSQQSMSLQLLGRTSFTRGVGAPTPKAFLRGIRGKRCVGQGGA